MDDPVTTARRLHSEYEEQASEPAYELAEHSASDPNIRTPAPQQRLPRIGRTPSGRVSTPPDLSICDETQSAVAHIRALARKSIHKNKETVAFAKELNRGLRAMSKRMQQGAAQDSPEERRRFVAASAEELRDRHTTTAGVRLARERLLHECMDRLVVARNATVGEDTGYDQRSLLALSATYDTTKDECRQLKAYASTLRTMVGRAHTLRVSSQKKVEELQRLLDRSAGDIETMKETLRLLHEVKGTATTHRDEYLKGLVADKLAHSEQIAGRQRWIATVKQQDVRVTCWFHHSVFVVVFLPRPCPRLGNVAESQA